METPTWIKWFFGLIVFALASVGLVWLSGFFFIAFSKSNPFGATDFTTWYTYWEAYQTDAVIGKRLRVSAIVGAVVAYGVPIVAYIAATREIRLLHGEARFANVGEIEKAGLFSSAGILVGKHKNKFLHFPGMQFVLLAAPTRSGKGVGIVIPNLLTWAMSVVVLDLKMENYKITSKYRAENGQDVFLFNPFSESGHTHRYNPLGYISDNPRLRVTEILSIGYSLYPGAGKDAFFDDAARNLFLGLTLFLCETPSLPRTIGELLRQSSGKGQPVKNYLQGIINERNYKTVTEIDGNGESTEKLVPITNWDGKGSPPLSMECVDSINRFTSTSDNTLSSILASFNTPLTLWVSPIVDASTSENDFDLREVRKKKMTIYVGIPANKLSESRLLLNIFFSQLVNLNLDDVLGSKPDLKYQCLMLMDEFTAAGMIGIIDKSNSFMAGYGMRLLTIIQSPSQIEADTPKGYGREPGRTLITNHALQILYTPREQRDANEYSEMLGNYTFKARSVNLQERSKGSESDQRRALLMPQELKEMSQRQQIISMENTKPIQCEKIAYYSEPVFMNRLKSVSPSLTKLGKKLPNQKQLENVWGSGELSSFIPVIDFDLHESIVQSRSRKMTSDDIDKTNGINLNALVLDTSKIPVPESDGIDPDEVEDFVNGFFDALDDASEDEEEIEEDNFIEQSEFIETEETDSIEFFEDPTTQLFETDFSESSQEESGVNFNENVVDGDLTVEKNEMLDAMATMDAMFNSFESNENPEDEKNIDGSEILSDIAEVVTIDLSVLEKPTEDEYLKK